MRRARTSYAGSALFAREETTFELPEGRVYPTRSQLLLGPPHTGLNHLAEFLFLMHLGSLQWSEIARHADMRLRELRSEEGNPVYASFYYVWESFSLERPMSSFRIDDLVTFFSAVRLWGGTAIDGWHAACPEGVTPRRLIPPHPHHGPRADGLAWVRMSNVFVKMKTGPEELEVALPSNLPVDRFPTGGPCLETYRLVKEVRGSNRFPRPPGLELRPLGPEGFRFAVDINPDRDINGIGLVYFANFVAFMDAAERALLREALPGEDEESRIDRRTLVDREIAYYGNAAASDHLVVDLRAYEILAAHGVKGTGTLLWMDYILRRDADDKIICLSRAIKTIPPKETGRFV